MESLDDGRKLLAQARRVAVLTGAGVSAESGLATFRATDGLWEGHRVDDVATPEGFARNPGLVWEFYEQRRIQAAAAEPNPGHLALAQAEHRYESFALITQNVDGLHARAGSSAPLEVHGSLWTIRCDRCGSSRRDFSVPQPTIPPICQGCGRLERPAVVWFGESLPETVWESAVAAIERCEVLLVAGTSAQVFPVAGLIPHARRHGAQVVEVNPDPGAFSDLAAAAVRAPSGEALPRLFELRT